MRSPTALCKKSPPKSQCIVSVVSSILPRRLLLLCLHKKSVDRRRKPLTTDKIHSLTERPRSPQADSDSLLLMYRRYLESQAIAMFIRDTEKVQPVIARLGAVYGSRFNGLVFVRGLQLIHQVLRAKAMRQQVAKSGLKIIIL